MAHGVLKRTGNDGKTGIGSRRIFAPAFKLQVLDSYRNDQDCKGNQRATARKYGIHRRQIQKWLQVEGNLRNCVMKSKKEVALNTSANASANTHEQDRQQDATRAADKRVPDIPDFTRSPSPSKPIDLSLKPPQRLQFSPSLPYLDHYPSETHFSASISPVSSKKLLQRTQSPAQISPSQVHYEPETLCPASISPVSTKKLLQRSPSPAHISSYLPSQAHYISKTQFAPQISPDAQFPLKKLLQRSPSPTHISPSPPSLAQYPPETHFLTNVSPVLSKKLLQRSPSPTHISPSPPYMSHYPHYPPETHFPVDISKELLQRSPSPTHISPFPAQISPSLVHYPTKTHFPVDISKKLLQRSPSPAHIPPYLAHYPPSLAHCSSETYFPVNISKELLQRPHFQSNISPVPSNISDQDVWDLSTKRPSSSPLSPRPIKLFKPYLDNVIEEVPSPSSSASIYINNNNYAYEYYYAGGVQYPKQRQSYSVDFKLSAIECYYSDAVCRGNQRAVATKFKIHRRQVQKWLKQEDQLRQRVQPLHIIR